MSADPLSLEHIISHRFRGFGEEENTIPALLAALEWGVKTVEFDVRIAKCGTPMVYHDEWAIAATGRVKLCDVMARDFDTLGGRFPTMPTLDALLSVAAAHDNAVLLLIDIKDAGFEDAIRSLVRAHGLQDRVVYVSWLAEVLYAMHALEPSAPLCFSHWPASPTLGARATHTVHVSQDGTVPRGHRTTLGERSGWYLKAPLRGELLDILARVGGYVCVPVADIDLGRVVAYSERGVGTTAFSYVTFEAAMADFVGKTLAMVFSDSLAVFEGAQSGPTSPASPKPESGTSASPSRPGMA